MALRDALGRGQTSSAVAAVALAVLGAAYLLHSRHELDPDRLWRSIRADLETGELDSAEASLARLLQLRTPTDEHWMVLGQLTMARGRDAEALENLAHVSDEYPQAARARTWEGTIELKNQRARKAEEAFLRAVRLDPHDPAPRRDL